MLRMHTYHKEREQEKFIQWLKKVPPKVISAIDFNSAISLGVNFL